MSFLFITALTVSIDSFICGFSLALKTKRKSLVVILITLTVFAMCLATNCLSCPLKNYLTEKTASFSGLILVGLGVYNLLKKDNEITLLDTDSVCQILIAGFAVGIDGAVANLSLSIMGYTGFCVPVIIALMHGVLIGLGILLSSNKICKKISQIDFIAPLTLISLGIYKFMGFFL